LPIGNHVAGPIGAIKRNREGTIAVLEGDLDGAVRARPRFDLQRYPEIIRDRLGDCHFHAEQSPAQHNALARELDDAHPSIGGVVLDCKTHRQPERVEPLAAARPGRSNPAER